MSHLFIGCGLIYWTQGWQKGRNGQIWQMCGRSCLCTAYWGQSILPRDTWCDSKWRR